MPVSESKFGLTFARNVDMSTEGSMSYTVSEDTTITRVEVIIYGAEALLKLRPVIRTRSGDVMDIIETVGKSEIDGDNDKYKFDTELKIEGSEEIEIQYENQDSDFKHRFRVNMNLEETEGGSLW